MDTVPTDKEFLHTKKSTHTGRNGEPFDVIYNSDIPSELVETDTEGIVNRDKLEEGVSRGKRVTHKLHELTNDYYMFTLAPLYWTLPTKHTIDMIYQFGKNLCLKELKDVITYRAPVPMFEGTGDWDYVLQGIPNKYADTFRKYLMNAVFYDLERKPAGYWRCGIQTVSMYTPGVISEAAKIDIFLPSSVDATFVAKLHPKGYFQYVKRPPEDWVVTQAYEFFQNVVGQKGKK